MKITPSIRRAARKYQPVTVGNGSVLWPVTVDNYELFQVARPALEVLHQSLPLELLRLPLLAALYRMDFEAVAAGRAQSQLFSRTLLLLALSLRLGDADKPDEMASAFSVVADREDPGRLLRLAYVGPDGETHTIAPQDYTFMRELIALQNGVELESEQANPDIVQAQKDMAASGGAGPPLEANLESLVSSVAALSHADEAEVYGWPIRKLTERAAALERAMGYIVCAVAEGSGATWKHGNPIPHPFFRRRPDGPLEVLDMADGAEFAPGFAKNALPWSE